MSGGASCKCDAPTWQVIARNGNRSAFNGYHWTPSKWSAVRCTSCRAIWRTLAAYVATLPDAPANWWEGIR